MPNALMYVVTIAPSIQSVMQRCKKGGGREGARLPPKVCPPYTESPHPPPPNNPPTHHLLGIGAC